MRKGGVRGLEGTNVKGTKLRRQLRVRGTKLEGKGEKGKGLSVEWKRGR